MKKSFNTKLFSFIIAALFGIILSIPSLFQTQGPKITLGLDLQGGLNLLLGVKTEEAVKTRYASLASGINYYAIEEQILLDGLKVDLESVVFELLDSNEKEKIDNYLKEIQGLNVIENGLKYIELKITNKLIF